MRRYSESEWRAFFKRVRPGEEETNSQEQLGTLFLVVTAIAISAGILIAIAI